MGSLQYYGICQHTEFHEWEMHIHQYVVPDHLFSMVAENHLCAEVHSGCGIYIVWRQKL